MKKKIFKYVMLAAFLMFAGVSAFMVSTLNTTLGSAIIASSSEIPKAWSELPVSADAKVSLDVSTSDALVIYTAAIQNTRADENLYLTNFASYLDEAHGSKNGFLPLDQTTAEFTYNPDDNASWNPLELSAPRNGAKGFRLANSLTLGSAGSDTDTLYVRFQVTPSLDQDVVSDKVAALVDDGYGYSSLASASTSVAVNIESMPVVVAADTPIENPHAIFDELFGDGSTDNSETSTVALNDDSGESAFAQPLGVSTELSNLKTLASAIDTDDSVDSSFISTTNMILIAILGVFAIAFIGYIVVVKD